MRLELETDRFYLGRNYSEALAAAGGIPMHLGLIPDEKYISHALEGVEGILLPGSDTDIDPDYFGEEPHPALKRTIPVKDETDLLVLKEAEKRSMPVLAICYGAQALNVHHGGTLFQDIHSQIDDAFKHDQGKPADRLSHRISFENGGRLSRLAGEQVVRVNSHHHQSIKAVGSGLILSAASADGVIEAVEGADDKRFLMGVQWHPELTYRDDKFSREIFNVFVEECRVYRERFSIVKKTL